MNLQGRSDMPDVDKILSVLSAILSDKYGAEVKLK